jgi:hypothetical protein
VDEAAGRIYFGTAPGSFADVGTPQRPTVHALDAATGAILWQNTAEIDADASFSPTSAVPGVAFTSGVSLNPEGLLRSYDVTSGDKVGSTNVSVGLPLASAPAIIDGLVICGGGLGVRNGNPNDIAEVSSRVPNPVTALCVPGTRACATDQPVFGSKLRVQDKQTKPKKRQLKVKSKDSAIVLPEVGGAADPILGGAVLELVNPISGERERIALPASGWSGKGNPPGSKSYLYRDKKQERGPCSKALVRSGKLQVICKGDKLGFTLDEAQQGVLAVGLTLGNAITYCMRFGGDVIRDVPTESSKTGKFIAKKGPVPVSCPLP